METIISGILAGLVAWGGIRVELNWMRRDIDELREAVKSCKVLHV